MSIGKSHDEVKLHLGCGNVHLDGWVNIDRRYQPGVDVITDVGILKDYPSESVDEIYACHVLDLFGRWHWEWALRRWHDALKPGGTLWLSTVDFGVISNAYADGACLRNLQGLLYAAQDYEGNSRRVIFDIYSIDLELSKVGFTSVKLPCDISDWPGHNSNDCSLAEFRGKLLSMNIRAVK